MSAAPHWNRVSEVQSAASAAPAPRQAPRQAPQQAPQQAPRPVPRPARRRIHLPAVLGLVAAWLALMFLAFSVVQTRMTIRSVEAATAQAQRQIAQLQEQNHALEAMIANAASVEEVERWALEHGMQPPVGVAETLEGRPEAVAARTAVTAEAPAPEVTEAAPTIWQALLEKFQNQLNMFAAR